MALHISLPRPYRHGGERQRLLLRAGERETIGALNALAMRQEKRPRIGRGQVTGTAAERQRSSVGESRALQLSEKVAERQHHIGQNSNPECVHREIWYLHEDANDRQHNEYE